MAQGRGLDEPREFRNEARIDLGDSPTPAPGAANFAFGERFRVQVVFAAIDRRAARPVNRDTTVRPPHPAVRTSAAANNRRPLRRACPRPCPSDIGWRLRRSCACARLFVEIQNPSKPSYTDAHRARFDYCSECPNYRRWRRRKVAFYLSPILRQRAKNIGSFR